MKKVDRAFCIDVKRLWQTIEGLIEAIVYVMLTWKYRPSPYGLNKILNRIIIIIIIIIIVVVDITITITIILLLLSCSNILYTSNKAKLKQLSWPILLNHLRPYFLFRLKKNRVWVQGSTRETQTALKPELDCTFALAEWNFTNNWSQEEYIQTFSGKFVLSCTFQYHLYILIV